MFGQHPAKPAICSGCVRNVSSGSGFILILGGPFSRLYGPSYLLVAVAVVLENRGEKFELLCQGVLVTESFGSVYQGGED